MSKKLTIDYLEDLLNQLFWNDQFQEFDTEGALVFLYDMGFLDHKKINTNSFDALSMVDKKGKE